MANPVAVLEMVIELLAAAEVDLRARVTELEADVAVYRLLLLAAFDALRALTVQYDALRERQRDEADRARWQREEWLLADGADEPGSDEAAP